MAEINQEEIELRICLARIGFNTNRLRDAIVTEGFTSINDLADIAVKDVSAMCKKISGLSNARGGILIGYNLVRRLKGFVFWVKDQHRRNQIPLEEDFDLDVCKNALERMDIEEKRDSDDAKIEPPGKLKAAEWLQWELKFINFLQSIPGASGVPLNYVVRKDIPDIYEFANDQEELINSCLLEGAVFNEDNRKVFGIIKQLVAETPNWDWIKTLNRAQDGRAAIQMLRAHFDGPGEVEMRIADANQSLEALHYVYESKFPFSGYVTALNAGYKTLEEAVTERNKVSIMLKGIRNNNAFLVAAMQSIRTRTETKSNFTSASNKLSEQIAVIFPAEHRRMQWRGGRRISAVRGRGNQDGRGRNGRYNGRGSFQGRSNYRGGGRNNGGYRGGYRGGMGRGSRGDRQEYQMLCN
jgi:hypothetical protein